MTFKQFLYLMMIATIAAWGSWVVVLFAIDPTRSGAIGFVLFYVTLFFALVGTLTMVGTGVRHWRHKDELISRQVLKAFRQACLFAGLILGSLLLFANGYFRWWTVSLLMLLFAVIELVFITASRPRITPHSHGL